MKTYIINQRFGVGDIIFCQTIANDLIDREPAHVIWPVEEVYVPLAKHFPNVTMVDSRLINIDYARRDFHEHLGASVIPLCFSDSICRVVYRDCMKSKYMLFDLEWQDWKRKVRIERDVDRENTLIELLGVDNVEFNLISTQFTTGGKREWPVDVENGFKNVYMRFIKGFTLIDWMGVIERATTIHAVASSNIYLFELYQLSAREIHLYPRKPIEHDHRNYDYILTKNYILHP